MAALESDWRDLCARVPAHGYAQTFDWTWRGWECVASKRARKLRVVVGRADGRMVLLWPLVIRNHLLWRTALWLGSESSECHDALVEPGPHALEWLSSAWKAITTELGIDVLDFRYMHENAQVIPLIENVPAAWKIYAPAPFVDIGEWPDWDGFLKVKSKNFRGDQRRRRRRLAERGTVAFETVDTEEDIRETMDWLLRRKMSWLERTETSDVWFQFSEHHDFLKAVAFDAHSTGTLRLERLRVDDTTIAASLGFLYKGRMEVLVNSYDRAWFAYGPGQLLWEECLKWCFRNDVRIFDFRMGDEAYKSTWTNKQATIGVHLIPCTRRGGLYVFWFGSSLRGGLKKAFRRIPKGIRTLMLRALRK